MAAGVEFEGEGATEDAVLRKDVRGGTLRGTVWYFDEDAFGRDRAERLLEGIPEIASCGRGNQEKNGDD